MSFLAESVALWRNFYHGVSCCPWCPPVRILPSCPSLSFFVRGILGHPSSPKNEDTATLELLKKGKEVTVEGFFKPESYTKDGKSVTVLKNVATKVTAFVREKKQDSPEEEGKKA